MKIDVLKIGAFTGSLSSLYGLIDLPNSTFATLSANGQVVKWDIDNPDVGIPIANTTHSSYTGLYLQNENQIIIAENYKGLHFLNLEEHKQDKYIQLEGGNSFFAIVNTQNTIWLGASGGDLIAYQPHQNKAEIFKIATDSLRCLALHRASNCLLIGSSDSNIYIFDINTKKTIGKISQHNQSVFNLLFTHNQKYLIAASRDASITVYDVDNNYTLIDKIQAHLYAVNSLAISPSGLYLASASMDKTIKIWNLELLKLVKVIDRTRHGAHANSVNALVWKADGTLISAADDRTAYAWRFTNLLDKLPIV